MCVTLLVGKSFNLRKLTCSRCTHYHEESPIRIENNMNRFIVTFSLATIVVLCIAPVSAQRRCRIATYRVTGKNSLFSLVCRCGQMSEALGRKIQFLDPHTPDTMAQERLTVSCIERRKHEMERACQRSAAHFERSAEHVLRLCMGKRPKNPTREGLKPFMYRRDQCEYEFRELDVPRKEVLLVCGCTQRPGYIVHPGVTQFLTVGSPNGEDEEQKFMQKCTKDAIPQLNDACKNIPGRFDLRSAQAFNVCCKRARVKFALEKLKCQATVPDDISAIELTF